MSVGPQGVRGGAFPHRVLGVPVGQRVGISSFAKHSASRFEACQHITPLGRGDTSLEIADLGTAREAPESKRRQLPSKSTVDLALRPVARRGFAGMTSPVSTVPYVAPEVWFGGSHHSGNEYGNPMDLWSLGTIIFELLTLDMFASGHDDVEHVVAAVCRLGDFSEQRKRVLGPRQPDLL